MDWVLVNIEQFLISQQAGWVFRAATSTRDNWRGDLHHLRFGNPSAINSLEKNPVLKGIATFYGTVIGQFLRNRKIVRRP
jgi:hypothetical protein